MRYFDRAIYKSGVYISSRGIYVGDALESKHHQGQHVNIQQYRQVRWFSSGLVRLKLRKSQVASRLQKVTVTLESCREVQFPDQSASLKSLLFFNERPAAGAPRTTKKVENKNRNKRTLSLSPPLYLLPSPPHLLSPLSSLPPPHHPTFILKPSQQVRGTQSRHGCGAVVVVRYRPIEGVAGGRLLCNVVLCDSRKTQSYHWDVMNGRSFVMV